MQAKQWIVKGRHCTAASYLYNTVSPIRTFKVSSSFGGYSVMLRGRGTGPRPWTVQAIICLRTLLSHAWSQFFRQFLRTSTQRTAHCTVSMALLAIVFNLILQKTIKNILNLDFGFGRYWTWHHNVVSMSLWWKPDLCFHLFFATDGRRTGSQQPIFIIIVFIITHSSS